MNYPNVERNLEVCRRHENGETMKYLSKIYGVTVQRIFMVLSKKEQWEKIMEWREKEKANKNAEKLSTVRK